VYHKALIYSLNLLVNCLSIRMKILIYSLIFKASSVVKGKITDCCNLEVLVLQVNQIAQRHFFMLRFVMLKKCKFLYHFKLETPEEEK
jgi:hypothetical protein